MREQRRRALRRLIGLAAGGGAALAVFALVFVPAIRPLTSAAALGAPVTSRFKPLATRSVVYDRKGNVLALLHADEDRELARLDQMPASLVHAVVDAEDRRFFEHAGVDVSSVVRAAVVNAQSGHVAEGGSTITQQLVKNEILTSRRDVGRKVKEAALALRLEHELSKNKILERYMNTVYFGEGAYGVQAAAEHFFGENLGDLTPPQSALLAGLIRNPEGYDPFSHPDNARARREYVLRQMVADKHLDPAEFDADNAAPLPTAPQAPQAPEAKDYFVEEVKRRLLNDVRLGSTYQQRYHSLFRGGLRITTTLDPDAQAAATKAVEDKLPQSQFTAALVAMDPKSGEVRALVGGPNFDKAKFNLATQGARQAGSAFKTITLAAALKAGRSPNDQVDATAPCSFMKPGWTKPWVVNNYEPGEGGIVSLTDATVFSLNCAYANLVLDLGPQKVVDMAHDLGIQRHLDAFPSITLGTEEVSPLEMATVFSTFADEGVRHDPVFVTKVQNSEGKTLFENHSTPKQALDAQIVRTETSVLQQVIQRGTGTAAGIGRPAAGKTGTAEDWHDAWFCGYTPQLAAVVWMGDPQAQVPMYNVGGVRVVGGTYPAQIWGEFMKQALAAEPVRDFAAPDTSNWESTFIGQTVAPPPTDVVPPDESSTTLVGPPPTLVPPGVPFANPNNPNNPNFPFGNQRGTPGNSANNGSAGADGGDNGPAGFRQRSAAEREQDSGAGNYPN